MIQLEYTFAEHELINQIASYVFVRRFRKECDRIFGQTKERTNDEAHEKSPIDRKIRFNFSSLICFLFGFSRVCDIRFRLKTRILKRARRKKTISIVNRFHLKQHLFFVFSSSAMARLSLPTILLRTIYEYAFVESIMIL